MPRIALVTTVVPANDPDREIGLVAAELRDRGHAADEVLWWAPDVDWAGYDLVVVKSPWDYSLRVEEFLAWLDRVDRLTRVRNDPALIRWNLDKAYLGELAAAGVAVVPVRYCRTQAEIAAAIAATASDEVVIKPSVSASSRDTGLFCHGDPAALELGRHILGLGKVVMVQPAIRSVATVGERALLFFDRGYSHAIRKGPLLALGGGLRTGSEYVETIDPDEAPDDERVLAAGALAAAERVCRARGLTAVQARPTYARVDIARDEDDRPVLLELELFEPSWFCDLSAGSVARAADAIVAGLS